jgi:hypothetical protein
MFVPLAGLAGIGSALSQGCSNTPLPILCVPGASCSPWPDPFCHASGVIACPGEKEECVNGAPQPDGTRCGGGSMCCAGECTGGCLPNACTTQPDKACHDGVIDCSKCGRPCINGAAKPDNTICDTNSVCKNGVCTPVSVDLALTMALSPTPVIAGSNQTITLNVDSKGPATSTNVKVVLSLPSGFTVGTAAGKDWTCVNDPTAGKVTCSLASLPVGPAQPITIIDTTQSVGTFTFTATVSADQPVLDPTKATVTHTATVVACTDVTDDALCGAGKICVAGACVTGNCHGTANCSMGQVCKLNNCTACTDVTDDALCGAGKICVAGACITGNCHGTANCSMGQVCKMNNCTTCIDVTDDALCGAGKICVAGACVTGNCHSTANCSMGKVCKMNNCTACTDVTDDALCGAGKICVGGACIAGNCHIDGNCSKPQVCNNNVCVSGLYFFGWITMAAAPPPTPMPNNDTDPDPAQVSDYVAAFSSAATNLVSPPTTQVNVFTSLCPGSPTRACYDPAATTGRAKISLVSVSNTGAEGDAQSGGIISLSRDGRYVAFKSNASNLPTTGSNLQSNVFVRDTCQKGDGTTVPSCTPTTYLGSATYNGVKPNNGTLESRLSGDGVMVCFASASTNVVAGVTTAGQIYCRNTCGGPNTPLGGCTASTFLVSKNSSGTGASNFGGNYPVVSFDGRFVCYQATATDVVAGVTISGEFYCTDTCQTSAGAVASCTQTNLLVSQGNDGKPCASGCTSHGPPFAPPKPAMSDDGRFVVFNVDGAIALLPNDTNNKPDVYLRDTCRNSSGPVTGCTPTTSVISVGLDGNAANDQSLAGAHSISADGRFVVFDSLATNIVTGTFPAGQTFVRDTCGGASGPVAGCAPKTIRIPVESSGGSPAGGGSSIEGNGHFVVTSVATGCPSACRLQLALFATGF